ncbi:Cof-type HAD-IIB family hydrolase [uncultured Flavonifractor sp.]|uniref:Cof-type HAD-IIB family hydrolase n=1 Tax=uncultured Flavonifractor sp. TaxID=1193534 RepID=UPI00260ECCDF|nr:Cof-type HAD-IIB family hydrolase [uncultured Flavonifractor sp.]
MSDIRLICLDMDGTLLDDDHATVPVRNASALRAAAERGAATVISSGRAWDLLREVDAQLGVTRYAVLSNGASVLDVTGREWIYRNCLPDTVRVPLIELLLDWGVPFEVYCQGKNFIPLARKEQVLASAFTSQFRRILATYSQFPAELNQALPAETVEKIHVFSVPPQRREELMERALAWGPLSITSSFQNNMEFTAPGVNKGTAVQALCTRLGLGPEQVMAFGDAGNDLELLRWAEWSFAMANATAEAKAAARYLTGSNREAGVAMAVERYLLNR